MIKLPAKGNSNFIGLVHSCVGTLNYMTVVKVMKILKTF